MHRLLLSRRAMDCAIARRLTHGNDALSILQRTGRTASAKDRVEACECRLLDCAACHRNALRMFARSQRCTRARLVLHGRGRRRCDPSCVELVVPQVQRGARTICGGSGRSARPPPSRSAHPTRTTSRISQRSRFKWAKLARDRGGGRCVCLYSTRTRRRTAPSEDRTGAANEEIAPNRKRAIGCERAVDHACRSRALPLFRGCARAAPVLSGPCHRRSGSSRDSSRWRCAQR